MPLGKRSLLDAPAPPPNVELKRGTDAVLFEVVIRWQLHDALEQLGARLGLGRAELLEELVWLGWWCADQHELGREITARPAPQEPEELRLSRRFKRQLPTPASPAEQRAQRRAATHPKGMDALEHALERLASELPLKQRASK